MIRQFLLHKAVVAVLSMSSVLAAAQTPVHGPAGLRAALLRPIGRQADVAMYHALTSSVI